MIRPKRRRGASADPLEPAYQMADELRGLITKRLKIASTEIVVCPRAKSDMTPCIARDGRLAVCEGVRIALCVGCEHSVQRLLTLEKDQSS